MATQPHDYNPDMTPQDEMMLRIARALERIADVLESATEDGGERVRVDVNGEVIATEG